MKKILVPTDFSTEAEHALDLAYQIAKHAGGEITLLHVIDHPSGGSFNTSGEMSGLDNSEKLYMIHMIKAVQHKLQAIAADIKYPDVEILFKASVGKTYNTIAETMTNYQADLIVMGTTGSSGLEEFFVGSNAEKVVRLAKCPVITVRDHVEYEGINNILFATNFEDEKGAVLRRLMEYQKIFSSKIHLLRVESMHEPMVNQTVLENLDDLGKANQLLNYEVHTTKAVTVDQGIRDFAETNDMDMIAMTTHGNQGLTHLLFGSLAENIVNKSSVPVWTYSMKAII